MGGSEGVGVTDRGVERESVGCGVEHGVFVGVGVDGFGVPDPTAGKARTKNDVNVPITSTKGSKEDRVDGFRQNT